MEKILKGSIPVKDIKDNMKLSDLLLKISNDTILSSDEEQLLNNKLSDFDFIKVDPDYVIVF